MPVTSLAGSKLRVDEWGIEAVYSGSQKCLSCVPGLSPISFSEAAIDKIKTRTTPVKSWFLDMNLVIGYWGGEGKRAFHHTAPVNQLYALDDPLCLLQEESVENSWQRHQQHHKSLVVGLGAIGLEMLAPESERLTQLNTVIIPESVDDAAVPNQLLVDYNLEIGARLEAFSGKVWRIGLMGYGGQKKQCS